jgi:hypothetical protein
VGGRKEIEQEAVRVREQEGGRSLGNLGGRRGLRCEREAGGSLRGRPAGGQRSRNNGVRPGDPTGARAWPTSLSTGKNTILIFRCRDLSCKESNVEVFFAKYHISAWALSKMHWREYDKFEDGLVPLPRLIGLRWGQTIFWAGVRYLIWVLSSVLWWQSLVSATPITSNDIRP